MARLPKRYYPKFKRRAITGIPLEGKASSSEEKKNFFGKNNVDLAVLMIAILTAASYAIAYSYKLAQFMYYQIPIELIEINVKNVIWVLVACVFIIFFLYTISLVTTHPRVFRGIFNSMLFITLLQVILLLTFVILLVLLYTQLNGGEIFNKKVNISHGTYISIIIASIFLLFLNVLNLLRKLAAKYFGKEKTGPEKKRKTFLFLFFILSPCIIILYVPYCLGIVSSYISSNYYLIKGNSYSVVLTTYDDKFIVAPVNLKTKEITPTFSFLPMETDKGGKRQLQKVKTGSLIVKDPEPIKNVSNKKADQK